jgi:hypothetical protein
MISLGKLGETRKRDVKEKASVHKKEKMEGNW